MKNKVTVSIAGQEYTLVGTEEESYVRQIAAHVDEQVRQVADSGLMSENLRRQLKEALEESARQKMELSDARREIFKLQSKR